MKALKAIRITVGLSNKSGDVSFGQDLGRKLFTNISTVTGGGTLHFGQGYYVNEAGDGVWEDSAIIDTCVSNHPACILNPKQHIPGDVGRILHSFLVDTDQESILLTVGSEAWIMYRNHLV